MKALYIHESLHWTQTASMQYLEACIITLELENNRSITVVGMYAAPYKPSNSEFYNKITKDLETLLRKTETVICGDWNARRRYFGHSTDTQRENGIKRYQ